MKLLITTFLASLIWFGHTEKTENMVTIKVSGIKSNNGYILVALHDGTSDFPDSDGFKTAAVEAKRGTIEVSFEAIPNGEYAIALMHDENANEEFDMDANGMPLEGWGFSNNPAPGMGPADWSEASFDLEEDKELLIEMVYLNY